jgi:hypothetical protein
MFCFGPEPCFSGFSLGSYFKHLVDFEFECVVQIYGFGPETSCCD